jgi:hypothetical protein
MAKAKNSITVNVTKKNILEGKCSDQKKCAIAQALVDSGFESASVDGEMVAVTKAIKVGKSTLIAKFDGYLPNTAIHFIERFDDAVTNSAKKALKPFNFNIKLVSSEIY